MSKVSAKAPAAKTPAPVPAKKAFDPKDWAKNGVTEEEIAGCKQSFDLFDSDQGGSVDISGKKNIMQSSRPP